MLEHEVSNICAMKKYCRTVKMYGESNAVFSNGSVDNKPKKNFQKIRI